MSDAVAEASRRVVARYFEMWLHPQSFRSIRRGTRP